MKTAITIFIPMVLGILIGFYFHTFYPYKEPSQSVNTTQPALISDDEMLVKLPKEYDLTTIIEKNWETKTLNRLECGIELEYPSTWTLSEMGENCMDGISDERNSYSGFCLKSPDFEGRLGVPSNDVKSGNAVEISCETSTNSLDLKDSLKSCIQDKVEKPFGTLDLCQIVKTTNLKWLQVRNGFFLTQKGDNIVRFMPIKDTLESAHILQSIK